MKVYLIRHGQTNGNVEKWHQGWGDSHLTDKGISQAEELRDILKEKKFDRIICSDLLRTKQTCNIIFGEDADVEYDPRVREINNSVFMGQSPDDLYEKYGDDYKKSCHYMDFSAYGGESADEILCRTKDFLCSLEQDTTSKRIAVVTHGGIIKAIISGILGCKLYGPHFHINNCSATVLKYNNGIWSLLHLSNQKEI